MKKDRIWYDNDNNRIEMINDHKWKTALQKMQLKNLSCKSSILSVNTQIRERDSQKTIDNKLTVNW
jgi:hypothetical protein